MADLILPVLKKNLKEFLMMSKDVHDIVEEIKNNEYFKLLKKISEDKLTPKLEVAVEADTIIEYYIGGAADRKDVVLIKIITDNYIDVERFPIEFFKKDNAVRRLMEQKILGILLRGLFVIDSSRFQFKRELMKVIDKFL